MIKELETAKTVKHKYDGTCGTYVSVMPTLNSCKELVAWTRALGLPMSMAQVYELHCTVVWSREVTVDPTCDPQKTYQAIFNHMEYWDGHDGDGYIVAKFDSPDLQELHQKWLDRGCKHSFDDYLVHVTLATKLRPSQALLNRMSLVSDRIKGTPITLFNEQIENVKP